MKDKKIGVLLAFILFSVILLSFTASAELEVKSTAVSSLAIPEINKPAVFDLSITNLDERDSFRIYAISGINIEPNQSVLISKGDTKRITISVYPTVPLKISPDYYSFEYKILGEDTPAQEEELVLVLVRLEDAFEITADDINPDSESAVVYFKNKYGGALENVKLELSSDLFSYSSISSLSANENKKIEIPLDKEKVAALMAGPYIISVKITADGTEASKTAVINFNEKEGIKTSESKEGIMLQRLEIEKKNEGNTKVTVSVVIEKNLFASLFTSYNIPATKREISFFKSTSTFTKEIAPNESLKVVAKTNWWILLVVILAIWLICYLINKYFRNKIVMSKKVYFVRTKGGEFALKVSILVKARDFVERIRVLDRLPPMVKVFEKYGLAMPEKIDEKNRRLEWNIQAMSKGETRELNYIVYSKIGVVGRFELPSAEAFYEFMGNVREAQSNSVVYEAQ